MIYIPLPLFPAPSDPFLEVMFHHHLVCNAIGEQIGCQDLITWYYTMRFFWLRLIRGSALGSTGRHVVGSYTTTTLTTSHPILKARSNYGSG